MPQVTMPQLGEGVEQGTVGKWLKQVGDHVRIGDPLVEVVTDKVNAEVPSPFEGTLTRILVEEGATIANDVAIAEVETGASEPAPAAAPEPAAAPAPPASVPTAAAAPAAAPAPPAQPAQPQVAVPVAATPAVPAAQPAPAAASRHRSPSPSRPASA